MSLLDSLVNMGGQPAPQFSADDNGQVTPVQQQGTPGQLMKNMLAGALTGLAGGAGARTFGGAVQGGASAEIGNLQKQRAVAQQQAQQNFQNQQEVQKNMDEHTLNNVRLQMMNLQNAKLAHDNYQASIDDPIRHDELMGRLASTQIELHKTLNDLGATAKPVEDYSQLSQQDQADIGAHRAVFMPNVGADANGKAKPGGVLYSFAQNLNDIPNETPVQRIQTTIDPKTNKPVQKVLGTISPGKTTAAVAAQVAAQNAEEATKVQTQLLDTAFKKSEMSKNYGEANKANADAALSRSQITGANGNSSWKDVPGIAERVNALPAPIQAQVAGMSARDVASLLDLADGNAPISNFTTYLRKGVPGITRQQADGMARMINPQYDESLYGRVQGLNKQFSDTRSNQPGGQIASFNNFLQHTAQASDVVDQYRQRFMANKSPLINKPMNWLRTNAANDPLVKQLDTSITTVKDEFSNFIKNGHAMNKNEEEAMRTLADPNLTPAQLDVVFKTMVHQGLSRLDSINEGYKTVAGKDYPNLFTPAGKAAANRLGFGGEVAKYGTGGRVSGVQSAPQQQAPQVNQMAPPAGATMKVPGSDGQMHWSDGKRDLGVVQ